MKPPGGVFTVSLDVELFWGVRDKRSIVQYRDNLLGVRNAVELMLEAFEEFGIHATWAFVGFLFFPEAASLRGNLPLHRPRYRDGNLSPYPYIETAAELEPVFHFAPDVIDRVRRRGGQEIGTHTFSHYYCLEEGQSAEEFSADLAAAVRTAQECGVTLKSLVFPRNSCNPAYLDILTDMGISGYRGNEPAWFYQPGAGGPASIRKALRLVDSYVNLSGSNTYEIGDCLRQKPFNFPSSRFLRPFSPKLGAFDRFRLSRITSAMDQAAMKGRLFHLWWHPHNFGAQTGQNMQFLRKILRHYSKLGQLHGMISRNMGELADLALSEEAVGGRADSPEPGRA